MRLIRLLALAAAIPLAAPAAAPAASAAGRLTRETIQECLEKAAGRSGRTLSAAARRDLARRLAKTAGRQGDDVLRLVREGGLEMLEQGARHGDDFWRFSKAVPAAARSMALHADELLPLARRLGKDVLVLESRTPGLAARALSEFGEDSLSRLARLPPEDIPRLLGYAAKGRGPSVKRMLLDCYGRSRRPSVFLDALDWRTVMATGLSASLIIGAYKVSDGVEEGVKTVAREHPETFREVVSDLLEPVGFAWYAVLAILLMPILACSLRLAWKACRRGSTPRPKDP